MNQKLMLATVCFGLGVAQTASAKDGQGSFGILGAATVQQPSVNGGKVDGNKGYGGGVSVEIPVGEKAALEADLLYLSHSFESGTYFGAGNYKVTSGYLSVPVLLRYRPIPVLNLGVGGYYNRVITAWSTKLAGVSSNDYALGKNDFGFVLAIGGEVPVGGVSIVGDLRYTRGLTNNARSTDEALKFAELQLLAGVKFDF